MPIPYDKIRNWALSDNNTIKGLTFSRSGGFTEPLAASAAAIAASMESGSDGVHCEEMDSPKSDKDEDIEVTRSENEQMNLSALGIVEFGKEVEVPLVSFKGLWLTQWVRGMELVIFSVLQLTSGLV